LSIAGRVPNTKDVNEYDLFYILSNFNI